MKEQYLDAEKEYRNFFNKILRILKILNRLAHRKKNRIDDFSEEYKVLYQHLEGLKKIFFGRKLTSEKKKAIKKLKKLKGSLKNSISREEKFVDSKLDEINKRSEAVKNIYDSPIFSPATQKEKELIEEVVHKRIDKINEIAKFFIDYSKSLEEQRKTIDSLVLDPKHEYRYEHGLFKDEMEDELEEFFQNINNETKWELNSIDKCEKTIKELIEESKKIIKENKEIESYYFNPDDLAELKRTLGKQLLREENKIHALKNFLKVQRAITDKTEAKRLIAVHLTKHFPEEGILKPTGRFHMNYHGIGLRENPRHTIHFSLNGPTRGFGAYGQMGGSKYAIIIPLEKITTRIVALGPPDTIVFGDLTLPPGTEIITTEKSQEKVSELQKRVGKAMVLPVKNKEKLEDAVIRRIEERGYTALKPSDVGWSRKEGDLSVDFETIDTINKYFQNFFQTFESGVKKQRRLISYSTEKSHFYSLWSSIEAFSSIAYEILNSKKEYPNPRTINILVNTIDNYQDLLDMKNKYLHHHEEKSALKHIKDLLNDLRNKLKNMPTSKNTQSISGKDLGMATHKTIPYNKSNMDDFLKGIELQNFF